MRTLTDGTVGVLDHQDAHTVTTALPGYFFEKTVADLTTGANPATTAAPGDTLRYTLRVQTTDTPLTNCVDPRRARRLNPPAGVRARHAHARGRDVPAGADTEQHESPTAATNGAGRARRAQPEPACRQRGVDPVRHHARRGNTPTPPSSRTRRSCSNGAIKLTDSDDPNVNGSRTRTSRATRTRPRVQIGLAA